jgi:hypothetical protein
MHSMSKEEVLTIPAIVKGIILVRRQLKRRGTQGVRERSCDLDAPVRVRSAPPISQFWNTESSNLRRLSI